MSDLEDIKTSYPDLFFSQAGEPLGIADKLFSAKTVLLDMSLSGLAQQGPWDISQVKNQKEAFVVLRRPVQTDSANEHEPMMPFSPLTYWVVLGFAHPSPTCEPRDTPDLSITPFSTYWWQKKVQFTLTFTAPLKGDLQIKKKIKHI